MHTWGLVPSPAGALSRCQSVPHEGRLCPHHRQERLNTDDVHYAREIIGEYVQCYLGGDLWQSLHQKVRGALPLTPTRLAGRRWVERRGELPGV
jgi:hypothetical protein